ncbi:ATP-binding cassette domain-containing protein [Enterococcus durans]|uniref:ABC transporter ATP-binding protein n=1 Tax=Enterococcus durans TaxID=53345 RepID=UPI001883149D|nr:ATP-binding cassette domain-containing protein [Enterococcus durans]MBE9886149.1 ATP-binding cassette domain-containing protein [Enterococcus durans]
MLNIENVSKAYRKNQQVVKNLSLDPKKAKVIGVIGTNGAGKTTVFRMILGLLEPDSGYITWNGKNISEVDKSSIGYLPEEHGLDEDMTVKDYLRYIGSLKGMAPKEIENSFLQGMKKLGIENKTKSTIRSLSKGNKQKLQLLATMLNEPNLIILDEPFTGLDPINTNLLKKQIALFARNGATILFSSHEINQVEEICEHILLIHQGSILINSSKEDLQATYGKTDLLISDTDEVRSYVDKHKFYFKTVVKHENHFELSLKTEKLFSKISQELIQQNEISFVHHKYPSLEKIFKEEVQNYK